MKNLINIIINAASELYRPLCVDEIDFTSRVKNVSKDQREMVTRKLIAIKAASEAMLSVMGFTPEEVRRQINEAFEEARKNDDK